MTPGVVSSENLRSSPFAASAHPARFLANGGVLHAGIGVVRVYDETRPAICQHELRSRGISQWRLGGEPPRFFHDEALALVSGHRPCWSCRYEAFLAFQRAWESATGESIDADGMDERLEVETRSGVSRSVNVDDEDGIAPTYPAQWGALPDGVFVVREGVAHLVHDGVIRPWSIATGYGKPVERPSDGTVQVVTPLLVVDILRAGYVPEVVFP